MRFFDHLDTYGPLYAIGGLVLFIVIMVTAFVIASKKAAAQYDRLLAQCIADRRKEYECVSMLQTKSNPSVVPVPIVVPTRSR